MSVEMRPLPLPVVRASEEQKMDDSAEPTSTISMVSMKGQVSEEGSPEDSGGSSSAASKRKGKERDNQNDVIT